MLRRTHEPPPILITDLDAPPTVPHLGFRLWERAVLGLAALSSSAPLVTCLTFGRAEWGALGLIVAPFALVAVVVGRARRDTASEVPVSAPGWSATWSEFEGTIVPGERAA